jgi:hypothetical protein
MSPPTLQIIAPAVNQQARGQLLDNCHAWSAHHQLPLSGPIFTNPLRRVFCCL